MLSPTSAGITACRSASTARSSFKPAGWYYGLTDPNTGRREGQIENYGEDAPEKRERLYGWLNDADCIAMSSNRLWGSSRGCPCAIR